MSYVIIYDIKELDNATRLRVSRHLRKVGAFKLQQSVWELEALGDLLELAVAIRSTGGKAVVLKKQVVEDDVISAI